MTKLIFYQKGVAFHIRLSRIRLLFFRVLSFYLLIGAQSLLIRANGTLDNKGNINKNSDYKIQEDRWVREKDMLFGSGESFEVYVNTPDDYSDDNKNADQENLKSKTDLSKVDVVKKAINETSKKLNLSQSKNVSCIKPNTLTLCGNSCNKIIHKSIEDKYIFKETIGSVDLTLTGHRNLMNPEDLRKYQCPYYHKRVFDRWNKQSSNFDPLHAFTKNVLIQGCEIAQDTFLYQKKKEGHPGEIKYVKEEPSHEDSAETTILLFNYNGTKSRKVVINRYRAFHITGTMHSIPGVFEISYLVPKEDSERPICHHYFFRPKSNTEINKLNQISMNLKKILKSKCWRKKKRILNRR